MTTKHLSIMAAMLIAAQLSADSWTTDDIYVGVDYFQGKSDFRATYGSDPKIHDKQTDDNFGAKLKIGAADGNQRLQAYMQIEKLKEPLYDDKNDMVYEWGADFIQTIPMTPILRPFLQVGAGFGMIGVDNDAMKNEYIYNYTLKAGAGISFRLSAPLELIAGADYHTRYWSKQKRAANLEVSDNGLRYYGGINIHF